MAVTTLPRSDLARVVIDIGPAGTTMTRRVGVGNLGTTATVQQIYDVSNLLAVNLAYPVIRIERNTTVDIENV